MIYTVRRDPTNREVQITFEVVAKPSNRQTSTPIEKAKKNLKFLRFGVCQWVTPRVESPTETFAPSPRRTAWGS